MSIYNPCFICNNRSCKGYKSEDCDMNCDYARVSKELKKMKQMQSNRSITLEEIKEFCIQENSNSYRDFINKKGGKYFILTFDKFNKLVCMIKKLKKGD